MWMRKLRLWGLSCLTGALISRAAELGFAPNCQNTKPCSHNPATCALLVHTSFLVTRGKRSARLLRFLFASNYQHLMGFPSGSAVKNLPAMQEMQEMRVQSLGWEEPLEEEMATPVFLPGEWTRHCPPPPHGQRSLVGSSPWGRKELDIAAWASARCKYKKKSIPLLLSESTHQE